MHHNAPHNRVHPYAHDEQFTPFRCQYVPVVVRSYDCYVPIHTDDKQVGDGRSEEGHIAGEQRLTEHQRCAELLVVKCEVDLQRHNHWQHEQVRNG